MLRGREREAEGEIPRLCWDVFRSSSLLLLLLPQRVETPGGPFLSLKQKPACHKFKI